MRLRNFWHYVINSMHFGFTIIWCQILTFWLFYFFYNFTNIDYFDQYSMYKRCAMQNYVYLMGATFVVDFGLLCVAFDLVLSFLTHFSSSTFNINIFNFLSANFFILVAYACNTRFLMVSHFLSILVVEL